MSRYSQIEFSARATSPLKSRDLDLPPYENVKQSFFTQLTAAPC